MGGHNDISYDGKIFVQSTLFMEKIYS